MLISVMTCCGAGPCMHQAGGAQLLEQPAPHLTQHHHHSYMVKRSVGCEAAVPGYAFPAQVHQEFHYVPLLPTFMPVDLQLQRCLKHPEGAVTVIQARPLYMARPPMATILRLPRPCQSTSSHMPSVQLADAQLTT